MNEKGKWQSNFTYPGDKFRVLSSFSGAVYDGMGNFVRKLAKSDVQSTEWSQYLATGDVRYYLNIEPISFPYTISYEYSVDYKNGILTFPTFYPQKSSIEAVQESKYTLIVPENTKILSKGFNTPPLTKQKTEKGNDIYYAEAKNLPAIESEVFMPDTENFLKMLYVRPQNFVYDKVPGEITDWKSLGNWVNTLLKDRQILDAATKQKLQQVTAEAATDKEKVKILYDYLGKNTQYQNISLGIGGYQPMAAAEVCRIGFGDCKGLSNYLSAMLEAVGIKSYVTMIRMDEYSKNIFSDFANFNQFNHMILQVPLKEETLWLEATNTEVPFGFIHNNIAGHQAVVVKESGSEVVRLPDYPDSLNVDKNTSKITVSKDGKAIATTETLYSVKQYDDYFSFPKAKYTDQVDRIRSKIKLPNAEIKS